MAEDLSALTKSLKCRTKDNGRKYAQFVSLML